MNCSPDRNTDKGREYPFFFLSVFFFSYIYPADTAAALRQPAGNRPAGIGPGDPMSDHNP